MKSPRNKTPQAKKRASYRKDRRNRYGENSKSSRKNLPLSRAKSHRANRHAARQKLGSAADTDSESLDAVEQRVKSAPQKQWRKQPDTPLGEVVAAKLAARKALEALARDPQGRSARRQAVDRSDGRLARRTREAIAWVRLALARFSADEIIEVHDSSRTAFRVRRKDVAIDSHGMLRLANIIKTIPAHHARRERIACNAIRRITIPKRAGRHKA